MKLYIDPMSPNSRKVTATAAQLGLDVELSILSLSKGENRTPEFLKVNPNGKIPALTDGDYHLCESNAIMAYLCSKQETELWPKSNARYDIISWMSWELAHWGRWLSTYGFETLLKPRFGMGEADPKVVEEAAGFIARFGKVLDDHLADRQWIVGDTTTIADFAVGSHLTYRVAAKFPLDGFKNILAWEARLNELPAWRESMPKL